MKTESLQALLIDRQLGELPTETLELLEAWLAEHPESMHEALQAEEAVHWTRAAVRCFPELARPDREPGVLQFRSHWSRWMPLAIAASVAALVGGAAWFGYRSGEQSGLRQAHPALAPVARQQVGEAGPWARYAVVSGPGGGLTVVRRDTKSSPQL